MDKNIDYEQQLSLMEQVPISNPKNVSKGVLLEYRIKRLLYHMEYYAQTNIVLKTSSQLPNDSITDLDVYGYKFTSNFSHIVTWVDCKSGNANVLQRIQWINGIKNQINVSDVVFVKQNVRKNIKEYARNLDIKIFELSIIEQLEKNYHIDSDDWRGGYDYLTQTKMLSELSKNNIPSTQTYKNITNFISSDYWQLDCFGQIKKCITGIKQLAEYVNLPTIGKTKKDSIRWAIFTLICLFLLATFKLCNDIYYFSDNDKAAIIKDGLVSGTIPLAKRQEIVSLSYKMAQDLIKQYMPDLNIEIEKKINPNSPPAYYEAFTDLVYRITKDPLNWTDIPRLLDYTLMEYELKEKDIDETILSSDKLYCIKTLIHFICKNTGLSNDIFKTHL